MDPNMLAVARERNPDITFTEGDMANFDLGRTFDAVLCLFSAIGHVHTLERLSSTLRAFAHHVNPGGVVIVEPWITPDKFREGGVHALFVNEPDVKLARMNFSNREGQMAVLDMHHLVGTPERIEYFVEHLELFMFTHEENLEAFRTAGLSVDYDPQGLMGRGLYIGVKDGQ
jgi:SAM-dependent methyltransferase